MSASPDSGPTPLDHASGDVPGGASGLLDELAEVVFRTDAAGNWTYLNAAWTAMTGYAVEASLGSNFLDYVHPDERTAALQMFMAVVAGGADHCHHETRYRTRSGRYRRVELRATCRYDVEGALVGNSGTILDVTARRRAQQALRERTALAELVAAGAPLGQLPFGLLDCTPDLVIREVSPAAGRLLGHQVTPGDTLPELLERFGVREPGGSPEWGLAATALGTAASQYGELRWTIPDDGQVKWLQTTVVPLTGLNTAVTRLVIVLQDVTELRQAERQQTAVARLGQRGLEDIGQAQLFTEAVELVVETLGTAHAELLEALQHDGSLLLRAYAGWPANVDPLDRGRLDPLYRLAQRALLDDALFTEQEALPPSRSMDATTRGDSWPAGGSSVAVLVGDRRHPFGVLQTHARERRGFPTEEVDFLQAVANVLAAAIQRRVIEQAARHQSLHDPLTGLANRVLLRDRLDQLLLADRRGERGLALLLLDLDRFKDINDTLGHDAGDQVLRIVARRLTHSTREADTVARLGGDEFVVLLPGVRDPAAATEIGRELLAASAELMEVHGVPLNVQGSIGVALAPLHGQDTTSLLKRADVAMYRAKQSASGCKVYSSEEDKHRPERLEYLTALRRAVEEDQLFLHYQPKVDLTTGQLAGVEALVRWRHPSLGMVEPNRFVPLAEQTGLIRPLTYRVLALALAQARAWWGRSGLLPVSVNLSAQILHDPDLLGIIDGELQRAGVPASWLRLEVTESAVMANPAVAVDVITRLRSMGVQMALDDFGTGHSSLASLRTLPVQELKIDRSFVVDLRGTGKGAAIVRSVIDLAHALDLRVVAEGIEDEETCTLLAGLGCDEGQGFFLGRPVPADRLEHQAPGLSASRALHGASPGHRQGV